MTLEMVYVQIIGLKRDLLSVVEIMGRLGVMEIHGSSEVTGLALPSLVVDAGTLHAHEATSMQLAKINGLLDVLGLKDTEPAEEPPQDTSAFDLKGLTTRVQEISRQREQLKSELELLPRFEETVRKLLPLLPPGAHQPGSALLGLLASPAHAQHLESLRGRIQELTDGQSTMASGKVDETTYAMLLVTPASYAELISAHIEKEDVARLRLPGQLESQSLDTAIRGLRQRLAELPQQLADLDRELVTIANRSGDMLHYARAALQDRLETFEVLSHLGQTELTFVITGWIPVKSLPIAEATLHEEVGPWTVVHPMPMTQDLRKHAPIVMTNPRAVRPFETLTNLYSPPTYQAIDPSGLMAVFLPLFFGMMLGDIGYGIILLVISLVARRWIKTPTLRDIATVLAMGSAWGIVFGVVFGEFLGTLGEEVGLHPLWFDRTEPDHLFDLLLLAIGVGVVHIFLGLILGVVESLRAKNRHHLLERSGRLVGLIALLLLAGVLADILPGALRTPAIAGLIVATVLLAASLGRVGIVIAPIELIGLVGNVLSYLRIAAIGLASVYLAVVANEVAGKTGSLIVGIIIAVLLHALNLVLGAFGPTIHSLRLHYVEFFRNFYAGGGRLFQPFKLRGLGDREQGGFLWTLD